MTLRAFNNVNTEIKTAYIIFKDKEPIDQFTVDYLDKGFTQFLTMSKLNDILSKLKG